MGWWVPLAALVALAAAWRQDADHALAPAAGGAQGSDTSRPPARHVETGADDEAPPAKRRYVVAAMGDSLTDPRSHGGKYLKLLRERCKKSRFDSYGVGGHMVNQMRKRFPRDVLGIPAASDADAKAAGAGKKKPQPDTESAKKPKYTHVIVLGGINDICSDESAHRTNDKIVGDLDAMYRMAHDHGIAVIALTLPPWAGFERYYNARRAASTHTVNRWIRERASAPHVSAVFDVYPILSCGEPEFLCEDYGFADKVHWNEKGHEVVGEALHAALFADCE